MFGQWMGDNKIILESGNKDVIERLNNFKTIKVLYGNTFAMHLDQLKQLQNDIETVLNLIQTQQAEIEERRNTKDLYYENKELRKLLEKKDKIIGKMIDDIMTHYQVQTIRKKCCPTCRIGEKACTHSGIHRNCIKQYFERKVEEKRTSNMLKIKKVNWKN